MGYLNKVMLIGRLGRDVEKKLTNSGARVATLSIATTDVFNDRQGNRQERTEWHKVVMWEKMADLAEQYLRKGSQVYVEGSLRTQEWQDKDGNRRFTTEVVANRMQFLDSRDSGQKPNTEAPQQTEKKADEFIEDDIPF